jgi:RimJ/RimL family protein N-acetyltransferase
VDKPVLRGELVVLRPVREDDAEAMWEMLTDAEGTRLAGITRKVTWEETQAWCAGVGQVADRIDWAITHGSDEFLGEIVLNRIYTEDGNANLRMARRPGHRGRGLGSDATALVLSHAFTSPPDGLGLHRVYLDVLTINPRARILYDSFGFVEEGHMRDVHRDGEFWTDSILMAILEDEYRAAQAGTD